MFRPWMRKALGILTLIACPAAAWAEDPSPPFDKSGYALFNPTPTDQMRNFCTDRPTKGNAPCTVDAGHFQIETDILNWTRSSIGGTTQDIFLYTNPTLKLGLNDRMDLELNIAPLVQVKTRNNAAGTRSDQKGIGDLFARVKYNLLGNEGGSLAVSLLPYVKVPTARAGIGNKSFESGLIVPVSFALPNDFSLLLGPEIDLFRNSTNSGYHANFQGLINLSRPITSSLTGSVELWSDINPDSATTTRQWSVDFALIWSVMPNLQLDIGTNIGFNRATPDVQTYVGISKRF